MGRRYRQAKRAMRPNRIAARFISGGKHQTFTSIAKAPLRTHTITNKNNRRQQYTAARRRERQQVQRERRRVAREAAAQKRAYARRVAQLKKTAPKPPRKPRTPSVPIAVNPRTGKAITLREAEKALRDATERAERLAAGLDGDAPARAPRAPRKTAAKKQQAPRKAAPRKKVAKNAPPPPPPPPGPGKSLRGLYLAATCACQGTGRIYTERNGQITGSTSCPEHGRRARGGRRITSRRAMTDSGLPGVVGWLDAKYRGSRGNLDRKQERAVRQGGRERYAGPVAACEACDEGVVSRAFTDQLRAQYIGRTVEDREFASLRPFGERRLAAMARKAYPYDRCCVCGGVSVVPDEHAGPWFARTRLSTAHRPTSRERATGRKTAGSRS